jgi:hypothetical protein
MAGRMEGKRYDNETTTTEDISSSHFGIETSEFFGRLKDIFYKCFFHISILEFYFKL